MSSPLTVLDELRRHRDLALVLAWRELVVRYKRSVLGVGWALIEPLVMVGVYVVIFGHVLGTRDAVSHYWLFTLLGTVAWIFVQGSLEQCSSTLLDHSAIVKKTYFPRELLVLAVVLSRFSTLLVALIFTLGVVAVASTGDGVALARLPFLALGAVVLPLVVMGVGLVLSALQVIMRDVQFLLRFALRIGFYACPVVYPVTRVPDEWRAVYDLNPMVGMLWLFHGVADATLPAPSPIAIASASLTAVLAPVLGWYLFRRLQGHVGDLL